MIARPRWYLFLTLLILAWAEVGFATDPFLAKPYLQIGDAPTANSGDLILLWHAEDVDADWSVEHRANDEAPWIRTESPTSKRVAVPTIEAHRVYRAALKGLAAGQTFTYRVLKGGEEVFRSAGRARKSAAQPYRFVTVGDIAQGSEAQRKVAYQMVEASPDVLVINGDIVYARGRISEYREKYWPVYNADEASPSSGGPLIRSVPTLASPGNHDIGSRDLGKYPDGLAYFLYWDQPLNGPASGAFTSPLAGPEANQKAFLEAAGPAFPRMVNFSVDYGNAHWTFLDANEYVDWRDPALRAWVEKDLADAKDATWRFVSFHHPGFNSSKAHFEAQQMRLVADIFEAGKVDLVFSGHVHNYQRSFPTRFVSDRGADGLMVRNQNLVPGKWELDKTFDGKSDTTPEGVIYIVTGAGGAGLYNPEQHDKPETWQKFTDKFVSRVHSVSVADVDGKTLTVRQISADGEEVDKFVVTK
ncbi:metallophosphoesterase [Tundrisphaera lichenicola]|uniref:metallophosphoesterase n=1 Tax=Tundrisphaera lichenicola TaxID=2029860 RepID=UPI003EBFEB30